jgi:RNA polymerase sigma factor (sigma-70 family)
MASQDRPPEELLAELIQRSAAHAANCPNPPDATHHAEVVRCLKGELWNRVQEEVCGSAGVQYYARKLRVEIRDLCQEAFFVFDRVVLKFDHKREPRASLKTFLTRCVRFFFIDLYRKRYGDQPDPPGWDDPVQNGKPPSDRELIANPGSIHDDDGSITAEAEHAMNGFWKAKRHELGEAQQRQLREAIDETLQAIPRDYNNVNYEHILVFISRYLDELKLEEIAGRFGISVTGALEKTRRVAAAFAREFPRRHPEYFADPDKPAL